MVPGFISLLILIVGASVEVLADSEGNFKGLFFCTSEMVQAVSAWGEVIFLDGTYCLFQLGLTLMVYIVEDSRTHSEVAGIGLLVYEDRESFEWLNNCFKKAHIDSVDKIRCFMADKDLLERDVLRDIFPNIPIYICRFHVLKTFGANLTKLMPGRQKLKDKLLDIISKMVYSQTIDEYNILYKELKGIAPANVWAYFFKNWHEIKNEWTAFSLSQGNLGNFTNNRVESINRAIKRVIKKRSTLQSFLTSFWIWIESHNTENDDLTAKAVLKRPVVTTEMPDALLKYMSLLFPESFQKVNSQFEKAHKVSVKEFNESKDECTVIDGKRLFSVKADNCNCDFRTSMDLPCKHIFFFRKTLGLPLYAENLCAPRWRVAYVYREHPRLGNRSESLTANKLLTNPVVVTKSKKQKLKTVPEKRKFLQPIMNDILTSCSETCKDFDRIVEKLQVLKECLKTGKTFDIISQQGNESNKQDFNQRDLSLETSKEFDEAIADVLDLSFLRVQSSDEDDKLELSDVTMPTPRITRGRPSEFLKTCVSFSKSKNKKK